MRFASLRYRLSFQLRRSKKASDGKAGCRNIGGRTPVTGDVQVAGRVNFTLSFDKNTKTIYFSQDDSCYDLYEEESINP